MPGNDEEAAEGQVVIFAPSGRDAELACQVLTEAGVDCLPCDDEEAFIRALRDEPAVVVVAEEALSGRVVVEINAHVAAQPPWSDLPILILTRPGRSRDSPVQGMGTTGNVTFLERPARILSLLSAVRVALRSRKRQYEMRSLIERLADQDRRKDEFLAMLGHELRNPLAAIRTGVSLLEGADNPEVALTVEALDRQTASLTRIVDDLLEVSRVMRGKITLQKDDVDLAEIGRNVATALRAEAQAKGQSLRFEDRGPCACRVDPVRMEQVLGNLLHNAIKYTPESGHIRLLVDCDEEHVRIEVADDGVGIEPALLSRVFEPFMQVEASIDRSNGGLGLGLPLVRTLVELHGGTIGAESRGKGQGTTFRAWLPRAPERVGSRPPAKPEPGPSVRVAVIEDNPDLASMLEALLRRAGHRVWSFPNGEAALDALDEVAPDVMVVDVGLPGMDGYEVARRMRQQNPRVRLVAMTGYGQAEDRERSTEAGFHEHLVKPVAAEALHRVLAAAGAQSGDRG